ncbi:antitermination protein Q [Exilibacterium tricleocarpae]|uniref:Antitermination protein Q n=1 Tax=Exilibacterium tricleocarpae TaxID=2591008 RepID=A0A545U6V8_9GAMM|nr:antiterminator Q family protein [Exilibacterium tricleocarpae]TQV85206.1 antitermination protein Q [Exilibacterium tricleocarpae]
MSFEETEQKLTQWGQWVIFASGVTGYVSPAFALIKGNMGAVYPQPCISDDEALLVDRAVGRLLGRDRELGRCVVLYFVRGLTVRALGKELGLSKDRAATSLRAGVAWVDSDLSRVAA